MLIYLCIVCGCFNTKIAVLSRDRVHMTDKAKNIYCLALYKKSLCILDIEHANKDVGEKFWYRAHRKQIQSLCFLTFKYSHSLRGDSFWEYKNLEFHWKRCGISLVIDFSFPFQVTFTSLSVVSEAEILHSSCILGKMTAGAEPSLSVWDPRHA